MKNELSAAGKSAQTGVYQQYTGRKKAVFLLLALLTAVLAVVAINAGAAKLNPYQVLMTILGKGTGFSSVVIWNIRLPRVLAGIVAGAGLSVAGCVMQNNLRNPLASPSTLGISSAAAFGANVAIIVLGAGSIQILIQYFAQDVQVAAVVFWTFGDLGRASWQEVGIMATGGVFPAVSG